MDASGVGERHAGVVAAAKGSAPVPSGVAGDRQVDAAAERALQSEARFPTRSTSMRCYAARVRGIPSSEAVGMHPGQDVYWQDYYELRGSTDVLVFSGP